MQIDLIAADYRQQQHYQYLSGSSAVNGNRDKKKKKSSKRKSDHSSSTFSFVRRSSSSKKLPEFDLLPTLPEEEDGDDDDDDSEDDRRYSFSFRRRGVAAIFLVACASCVAPFADQTLPSLSSRKRQRRRRRRDQRQLTSSSSSSRNGKPNRTILYDDGTLFAPRSGHREEPSICEYFVNSKRRHTSIKRLHRHYSHCDDNHEIKLKHNYDLQWVSRHLDDYFMFYALAESALIPFTATCGDGFFFSVNDDDDDQRRHQQEQQQQQQHQEQQLTQSSSFHSVLARLQTDLDTPHGWFVNERNSNLIVNPEVICAAPQKRNFNLSVEMVQGIQTIFQDLTRGFEHLVDDIVIQYSKDNLLPYTDLIRQAGGERHQIIQTIAVLFVGSSSSITGDASDFVRHLQDFFPSVSIRAYYYNQEQQEQEQQQGQVIQIEQPIEFYARLVNAEIAAICSDPSFCKYALLGNRHGIRYITSRDANWGMHNNGEANIHFVKTIS